MKNRYKKDVKQEMDRAWAEISKENLAHNVRLLRSVLPETCDIMAVVKANAYGHGDLEISRYLNCLDIRAFAVATIEEGIRLRQKGVTGEILILGYTPASRASELFYFQLSQTVVDAEHAKDLNRFSNSLQVHVKVNTGMNRQGVDFNHLNEIISIFACKNLRINGIFTHLCVSDSNETDDIAFTNQQIQDFFVLLECLKNENIKIPKIHIQSSYGILNYPGLPCDYARIGIALYGMLSDRSDLTKLSLDLKPILSLKSKVSMVRTIKIGESVGYGREFIASKNSIIAVVSIGFADGIPRNLSTGKGSVLIRGHKMLIVGRICMDQLMVDVTGFTDIARGDIVTLIGKDGTEEIRADQMAESAGTITNELLSRLGSRLERIFF